MRTLAGTRLVICIPQVTGGVIAMIGYFSRSDDAGGRRAVVLMVVRSARWARAVHAASAPVIRGASRLKCG